MKSKPEDIRSNIDKSPKFSIIIAVFNGGKVLQHCINSISTQSYKDWELIIMDGGSVDNCKDILEKNTTLIKYWESKRDNGIAHAWNKALGKTSGEWILFLGADDRLRDVEVLQDTAHFLDTNNSCDLAYGRIVFEGGKSDGLMIGQEDAIKKLNRRMTIPHTAAFHRRNIFSEVGVFDESFKISLDYEILLRKKNLTATYIDRIITTMGGLGVSSKLTHQALRENRRAQIKNKTNNRLKAELFFSLYWLRSKLQQLSRRQPK